MKNVSGITQYRFIGESTRVEGGEKEAFEQVVSVPLEFRDSEYVPVTLNSEALFDAQLYVTNDLNEDIDQVYISDGAWGHIIENPENVEINVLDVLTQEAYEPVENQLNIERGLHFKGTIEEDVIFFRHFKPGGQPIDMSNFDYVSFRARGAGEVKVLLEPTAKDKIAYQKTMKLGQDTKRFTFLLTEFEGNPIITHESDSDLFSAISFLFEVEGNVDGNVELQVEDIYFGQGQPVSQENDDESPAVFSIKQNYPNPFSGNTTIEFEVPEPAHIQITLFDLLGRKVVDLIDEAYTTGKHKVHVSGEGLASGMYMYKMTANNQIFIQTMHVVR